MVWSTNNVTVTTKQWQPVGMNYRIKNYSNRCRISCKTAPDFLFWNCSSSCSTKIELSMDVLGDFTLKNKTTDVTKKKDKFSCPSLYMKACHI